MRPVVSGQQLAQLHNTDPFAPPIWRAPVYHTPGWIIAIIQIARTLWVILRFLARHPIEDLAALMLYASWGLASWPGVVALVLVAVGVLVAWRLRWPGSFTGWVHRRVLSRWRRWHYARHWSAVMSIARLAEAHRGRILVPVVLGRVTSSGCTDLVRVRLVSGQCPADYVVLLAAADACSRDDGTGFWPSAATITRMANISDRTPRGNRRLEAEGQVVVVA